MIWTSTTDSRPHEGLLPVGVVIVLATAPKTLTRAMSKTGLVVVEGSVPTGSNCCGRDVRLNLSSQDVPNGLCWFGYV